MQGSNVHLILCNGARLRLTGGLKLEGDITKLYLGTDNTLCYPSSTMTIGSFRAYFQEMAIRLMEEGRGSMDDAWFTLDGRRLDAKPTAKGFYICGGRKVMIK